MTIAAPAVARPGLAPGVEALCVTLLAALGYVALQGELPYHDAARFAAQVEGNSFVWDIAHILMQPAALLAYRWSGADPTLVLKMLSSLSTAAAVGLFHALLLLLGLRRGQAVLGTLLLAGCCAVLTLAPSAHPKLMAFPFVNAALLCLCLAERRREGGDGLVLLGGLLLAIGAGFLASVLATPAFAGLALLLAARRQGASWPQALLRPILLGASCGLAFAAITCVCFVLLTGEPLSLGGLLGSVAHKADLRPPPPPLPVHLARVVFGTVNNLVAIPELGATVQAAMRGQIPSLRPYAWLLPMLALFLLMAALIAAIYLRTLAMLVRGRLPLLMPLGFLCGAQAWTIYYGLNDPEHWFQLTAPTILLFILAMPAAVVRFGLPAWAAVATAVNLALLAVPVASYPVSRHDAELTALLRPQDLLLRFAAYPGRAYAGFFSLPGARVLVVDTPLREPGARVEEILGTLEAEIEGTLRAGGRVIVADILDPQDWEAPWMSLLGRGIDKPRLTRALLGTRSAERLPDVGGIKLWSLRPAAR